MTCALLAADGFHVDHVMASTAGAPRYSLARARVTPSVSDHIIKLPALLPETQLVSLIASRRQLGHVIRARGRPSAIVVTGGTVYHGWAAMSAGVPTVTWAGTLLEDELSTRRASLGRLRRVSHGAANPFLRSAERSVLINSSFIAVQSDRTRESVAAATGRDCAVVHPAVSDVWFKRGGDTPSSDGVTLAFVGRVNDRRKRFDVALDVAAQVADRGVSPVRLLATATVEELRSFAVPRTVQLRAIGHPPDGELADALRTARWLLLTSEQEGFGIVVAESLASGIPVASTASGGPEHVVRASRAGIIGSPAELVSAICSTTDHEWAAMSHRGRAYAMTEFSEATVRNHLREIVLSQVDGSSL